MKNLFAASCTTGVAAVAALCFSEACAVAQTNEPTALSDSVNSQDWTGRHGGDWHMGFSADYSAVAGRSVNFDSTSGHSGAQSVDAGVTAEVALNDQWFVPMGLVSHNLFLGGVNGAPIPDQIDTLGFGAGLGWHYNDRWTFVGSLGPRFYRIDDVDGTDVGIGGMLSATYKWKPNLTVALGLNFEPDRNVPVLPAAGLRWIARTNLIVSLMFPRSGVDYLVNRRLDLFAALDGEFTVFRAESDLANKTGAPLAFNNGLGTYRDFRIGVGVDYRLIAGLSATVQGGYSFAREIDYQRIGETVDFGSAPYVQAGLKYRF
jgi:Domain of unknown function (DUF6268)